MDFPIKLPEMRVFANYRQEDLGLAVTGILDGLRRRLRTTNITIFQDLDIESGDDWQARIKEELASCRVLLAFIGANWHKSWDDDVGPRLWHEDDWVRFEISEALQRRNIKTIPVFLDDTPRPKRGALPKVLQELYDRKWHTINSEYYEINLDELVRKLKDHQHTLPEETTVTGVEEDEGEINSFARSFSTFS